MSYQRGSRRLCSESAIMLVPRPEISTPTRARSGMVARRPIVPRRPGAARAGDGAAAFAGLDSADVEHDFSRLFKSFRYVFRINLGDDDGHADAAVEGARHLLRLDIPLRLEKGHQPRLRPELGVDPRVQPLGKHPRDILEQAAAGDMGHRPYPSRSDEGEERLDVDP